MRPELCLVSCFCVSSALNGGGGRVEGLSVFGVLAWVRTEMVDRRVGSSRGLRNESDIGKKALVRSEVNLLFDVTPSNNALFEDASSSKEKRRRDR